MEILQSRVLKALHFIAYVKARMNYLIILKILVRRRRKRWK
nr:MAG TPA: hypothetical protein [Caudoviricetes sp.]